MAKGSYYNTDGKYKLESATELARKARRAARRVENPTFTLEVRCPPRPPPRWLPSLLTRTPVIHTNVGSTHVLMPDEKTPNFDCFERKHLVDMPMKTIEIERAKLPIELTCQHVQDQGLCQLGCYIQEKKSKVWRKKCARHDCEGHVYVGRVKESNEGVSCFGEKGQRLVCLEDPCHP